MNLFFRAVLLSAICAALLLGGCVWHKKPKSSARIIKEGDPNPFITINPERAGETVIER